MTVIKRNNNSQEQQTKNRILLPTLKKNKKTNSYPNQTRGWDMARLYIQGITKDFCIEFKQKQIEFLVQYRAETDSLYQKYALTLCPIDHKKIDEIQNKQNNRDLIEERSVKGAMVRNRTKFVENEEILPNFFFFFCFFAAESVFLKNKTITALKDKSDKKVKTDKDILKTAQTFPKRCIKRLR